MRTLALAVAFLACIVAANWVTTEYGMVWVFGLTATAGTYFAGTSFVVRDSLQKSVRAGLPGQRPSDFQVAVRVSGVIVLGALLSLAIAPFFTDTAHLPPGVTGTSIAIASGVAFLVSETADLLVWTPLEDKGYIRAAVASNTVGAFVDTVLFLWISGFGVWGSLGGQMAGKLAVTGVVVLAVLAARGALRVREAQTA